MRYEEEKNAIRQVYMNMDSALQPFLGETLSPVTLQRMETALAGILVRIRMFTGVPIEEHFKFVVEKSPDEDTGIVVNFVPTTPTGEAWQKAMDGIGDA